MPLPTIPSGNVASAIGGGYEVANSCMFNNDDGAYMHKTPGSAGNLRTWTFSAWVKKCTNGVDNYLLSSYVDANNTVNVWFNSDDVLECQIKASGNNYKLSTNRVFRDVSAWINIIFAVDTTESTEGDRFKIWINGTRETSFATDNYPALNTDGVLNDTTQMNIGKYDSGTTYFDGYMAEVCLVDGSQLAATSFGEFDEDSPTIWKPIDVSGLTFGTNGFYCDYEDSANLGNDANGGTDLTEVNLAATDQATDTPTNNFCTMNPLDNYYQGSTFSEGNCQVVTKTGSGSYSFNTATFWLTSGKWYWEIKYSANTSTDHELMVGIASSLAPDAQDALGEQTNNYAYRTSTGQTYTGGSGSSYGDTWTLNDIVGVYLDLDNNKLYFSKNGTLQNSGTGVSITDPASTTYGAYSPAFGDWSDANSLTGQNNFGGCPSFSISSSVSDDNGFGSFEYSPNITGDGSAKKFYALCTKNLAEYG